jgi:hypothetical protein
MCCSVTRLETERQLENLEFKKEYDQVKGAVPINWPGQEDRKK